jgi:hypothetical protein
MKLVSVLGMVVQNPCRSETIGRLTAAPALYPKI